MGTYFVDDYLMSVMPETVVYIIRILFGSLLGLILGLERERRQKEAGIRTHFIVGAASSLMMVISICSPGDKGRIAAQVISGIGFLGAGIIVFRREFLHGLTTASGIWATSGIGLAAGAGLYVIAFFTTILVFGGQMVLHSKLFKDLNDYKMLSVKFVYTKETKDLLKKQFAVNVFLRFKATETDDGKIIAEAVIRTKENCDSDVIVGVLNASKDIYSIERLGDS